AVQVARSWAFKHLSITGDEHLHELPHHLVHFFMDTICRLLDAAYCYGYAYHALTILLAPQGLTGSCSITYGASSASASSRSAAAVARTSAIEKNSFST